MKFHQVLSIWFVYNLYSCVIFQLIVGAALWDGTTHLFVAATLQELTLQNKLVLIEVNVNLLK